MKLNQHFNKLVKEISLDSKRLERIEDSVSHLKNFVENDKQIGEARINLYLQGSYALGTGIKPQRDEFDVDVVLVLDLNKRPADSKNPKAIIEWVAERARLDSFWKGKISTEERCVRVNYAGDFHLDIVPVIESHTGRDEIYIPGKHEDNWQKLSNPIGYIRWFESVGDDKLYKFKDTVKLFKCWAATKFGIESGPKPILLTTLVGLKYENRYNSLAETFTCTAESLRSYVDAYSTVPIIQNPSLHSEDLAVHWTDDTFKLFKDKIKYCAQKAREALDHQDYEESKKLWKEVFAGFPQDISEDAKSINEARKSGELSVSSSGAVMVGIKSVGNKVYNHKYFGG